MARECFALKQVEALQELKDLMNKKKYQCNTVVQPAEFYKPEVEEDA